MCIRDSCKCLIKFNPCAVSCFISKISMNCATNIPKFKTVLFIFVDVSCSDNAYFNVNGVDDNDITSVRGTFFKRF